VKTSTMLSYVQTQALERIEASTSPFIIGIDEVGLGCIAGPVTVAAVVVPKGWSHADVQDSKSLTPRKRKKADKIVREQASCFCILSASSAEVDAEGVRGVNERLTEQVALYCLQYFPDALIVQDGDVPTVIGGRLQNMVWLPKADVHVPAVSAASCLAKVLRDKFMQEQDALYPGYDFFASKGYGTKKHNEGLKKLGACPIHRRTFKPVQAVL
jgi:ribonuclease HII